MWVIETGIGDNMDMDMAPHFQSDKFLIREWG
jgi:hypothetical protein